MLSVIYYKMENIYKGLTYIRDNEMKAIGHQLL